MSKPSSATETSAGSTKQHARGLQQAYSYDSQGRLQYTPENDTITSSDWQQAFQAAAGNSTATGMVLTPPGSYQVPLPVLTCPHTLLVNAAITLPAALQLAYCPRSSSCAARACAARAESGGRAADMHSAMQAVSKQQCRMKSCKLPCCKHVRACPSVQTGAGRVGGSGS